MCTALSAAFFAKSLASFACFIFSSISCSSSSSLRPSRSISVLMRVTSDLNMALSSGDTASVMLMICAASAFGFYLAWEALPPKVAVWLVTLTKDSVVLLLLINVMLIILGTAVEGVSALIILTPVLLPVILKLGIDPVHFGIILVTNLTIAGVTPPVGQMMFVSSQVLRVPMNDYAVEVMPFLGALMVSLLLLTYFPQLTIWLPNLIYGGAP